MGRELSEGQLRSYLRQQVLRACMCHSPCRRIHLDLPSRQQRRAVLSGIIVTAARRLCPLLCRPL